MLLPLAGKTNSLILEFWGQFRAGGMTSTFLTSPLDVVKTRLQSDFYKQQLAAKKVYTGGLIRQGARHFHETFQILALAPPHGQVSIKH